MTNYRVNVIGYKSKNSKNESGIKIKKYQIAKRFSIDKKGQIYRIEFYKNDKFAGMILVKFSKKGLTSNLSAVKNIYESKAVKL